ncbi:MAG: hypothetical protein KC466_04840 [Myxococcales bacterium]|nr:hypothetical protein [Myxococcales bacterium]
MPDLIEILNEHIGRREALRRTAFGSAALAGAALLPTGCAEYPRTEGLRVFTDKEIHVLRVVMETFLPKTRPEERAPAELGAAEAFDRLLAKAPKRLKKDLKKLLLIVEHGPLLFQAKLSRFTRLEDTERAAYLDHLRTADRAFKQQIYVALLKISFATYYDFPETWPAIAYDGPVRTRRGAPRPIGVSTLANPQPTSVRRNPPRIAKDGAPEPQP